MPRAQTFGVLTGQPTSDTFSDPYLAALQVWIATSLGPVTCGLCVRYTLRILRARPGSCAVCRSKLDRHVVAREFTAYFYLF